MLEDTLASRRDLAETIDQFQRIVWDTEDADLGGTERSRNIIRDLAYDLDYFESNAEWRRKDPSFYGEDRALELVRKALVALSAIDG